MRPDSAAVEGGWTDQPQRRVPPLFIEHFDAVKQLWGSPSMCQRGLPRTVVAHAARAHACRLLLSSGSTYGPLHKTIAALVRGSRRRGVGAAIGMGVPLGCRGRERARAPRIGNSGAAAPGRREGEETGTRNAGYCSAASIGGSGSPPPHAQGAVHGGGARRKEEAHGRAPDASHCRTASEGRRSDAVRLAAVRDGVRHSHRLAIGHWSRPPTALGASAQTPVVFLTPRFLLTKLADMPRSLLAVLCAALVSAACSEPAQAPPHPDIDPERIRTHVERLAAAEDEGGVEPGGRGEQLAVEYLTSAFTEIGLRVQQQQVQLTTITSNSDSLEISGANSNRTLLAPGDFVAWTRRHEPGTAADAEIVFVGYGISTPNQSWDDYKDVDVRGKVVLMLIGDPVSGERHLLGPLGRDFYGRRTYKFEEAERRGAAGAFLIHIDGPAEESWDVIERTSTEILDAEALDEVTNHLMVEGWITMEAADGVFDDAGMDLNELRSLAGNSTFRPVNLPLRASIETRNDIGSATSTNVVATLDGNGTESELVLLSSHWNDLPAGGPAGGHLTDAAPGNQPPGVGVMLEAARGLASEPAPTRSIVFLVVTAESQGLLGLEYYLRNPLYPVAQTRAGIHLAGFSVHPARSHISIIGFGFDALKGLVRERAAEQGRAVSRDTDPERLYYFRSGEAAYAGHDVPSIFLTSRMPPDSRARIEPAPPQDMLTAVLDARLLFHVGLRVANAGYWPSRRPLQ